MAIDITTINWDLLTLVKVGRAVKLMYDAKPFEFCTLTMYAPFGTNSVKKDWNIFEEYSISCSVDNVRNSKSSIEQFTEFIDKLETKIKLLAKDKWGLLDPKGTSSFDNTEFLQIFQGKPEYPKLMKLQITRDKNGNFTSFAFDSNKEKVLLTEENIDELLPKRVNFKCIIENAKVWVFNGRVGTIWNINQLKISEKSVETGDISSESDSNSGKKLDYSNLLID